VAEYLDHKGDAIEVVHIKGNLWKVRSKGECWSETLNIRDSIAARQCEACSKNNFAVCLHKNN
jgi:hypothetical protein